MNLNQEALAKAKDAYLCTKIPDVSEVPKEEVKRLRDNRFLSSWSNWTLDLRMTAAITAYIEELNKTHVLVPRELNDGIIDAAMDDRHRDKAEILACREIVRKVHGAIISAIDALAARREVMASINISEDDFSTIAAAANDSLRSGDRKQALALDKIARKINAALTANNPARKIAAYMGGKITPVKWQDVPSTLMDALVEDISHAD